LDHILAHTSPLWHGIRGGRVFLSGATGFFGAWLLESLLHSNRTLGLHLSATVLCRDPEKYALAMPHIAADNAITLWRGDIRSFDVPDHEYNFVVHAAAPTSADAAGRPAELLSTLIDGTRQMLALASSHGTRKFLFVSSGAVYGPQPPDLSHIPETYAGGPDWLDPRAAYAEGKRVAEQMCAIHARQSGIEFKIARCFAFVGSHLPMNGHFAIGNFIADALAGRSIEVRGDGTAVRSYLYAADLAIWLWTILLRGNPAASIPGVWNVGSGKAVTIRDLACTVAEELHPGSAVNIGSAPQPGVPRHQYVPDIGKAEADFGLRQTIGLREAIRRTADWHR
jgi:nucleoside-diphosphate-sugar epimerase